MFGGQQHRLVSPPGSLANRYGCVEIRPSRGHQSQSTYSGVPHHSLRETVYPPGQRGTIRAEGSSTHHTSHTRRPHPLGGGEVQLVMITPALSTVASKRHRSSRVAEKENLHVIVCIPPYLSINTAFFCVRFSRGSKVRAQGRLKVDQFLTVRLHMQLVLVDSWLDSPPSTSHADTL